MKDPKKITLRDIFYETENVTERRRLIELVGWERLLQLSGDAARVIQRTRQGTLYEIFLPDDPDCFMKVVKVTCPSTGNIYHLRVPPTTLTVAEAVSWTFGLDPENYKPIKET